MARNGSGTMALTTTFVADTDALAEDVNTVLEDIRDEITNSVAADGQTTITGALKGPAGTVSLPGYAFSSDLDSGIYRIGANNVGIAAGGAKIVDIGTATAAFTKPVVTTGQLKGATLAITGDGTVSGNLTVTGTFSGSEFASGTVMLFGQTSAPTGWTKGATHNDKVLRVVTGTASSGGTNAFSTVMAQTATGSHAVTLANLPATVAIPLTYSSSNFAAGGIAAVTAIASGTSLATDISLTSSGGSGTGHTHTITMDVQYVDVILASKD